MHSSLEVSQHPLNQQSKSKPHILCSDTLCVCIYSVNPFMFSCGFIFSHLWDKEPELRKRSLVSSEKKKAVNPYVTDLNQMTEVKLLFSEETLVPGQWLKDYRRPEEYKQSEQAHFRLSCVKWHHWRFRYSVLDVNIYSNVTIARRSLYSNHLLTCIDPPFASGFNWEFPPLSDWHWLQRSTNYFGIIFCL